MTEISGGYVNHAGSTRDSTGAIYAIFTQDGPNSGDVDVIVKRCAPNADPTVAASWVQIYRFTEAGFGKHGYGSGEVRNDGAFVAILAERNAAGETVARVHVIPGLCPPWTSAPAIGGSSAIITPTEGELWAFAKAPWVGDHTIPLAGLIPPSSSAIVRLVVTGAPGRMARLNNGALEGICQVAGVRSTTQGEIALDTTQTLHLSVAQELAECHVQVIGWRPV